jgi:2-phosphosulfolactate phosphatase
VYSQSGFSVRLEVGRRVAAEIAPGCDVAVVVDVLSFTTTLSVAADRGVPVLPCPWRDDRGRELARRHGATLAVRRAEAGPGDVSLSPGTVRRARDLRGLVLPSPNGSAISADLAAR